jgi:hypothetical protein
MSDAGNPPPPPVPESPLIPPPAIPPRRHGCLTAFMVIVGVILLLPGVCALIFGFGTFTSSGSDPVVTALVTLGLLVALGGIFLIWAAIRGPRA